ncbi:MAG: hypothetical protein N2037_12830 [Acidimicrobiales bacterium]|nr:hypothetical protein [Acidimicrobiales bacterium]
MVDDEGRGEASASDDGTVTDEVVEGSPADGEVSFRDVRDTDDFVDDTFEIERAVLNETPEGRKIQTLFVEHFGLYVREQLRPILRQVAMDGGQPQLLVNGLAELLRSIADSIEFPLDHPRSGFPPQMSQGAAL